MYLLLKVKSLDALVHTTAAVLKIKQSIINAVLNVRKKTVQQEPLTFFFKRLNSFLYLLEGSVIIMKSG